MCKINTFNFKYISSERQTIMGFSILWIMYFHSSVTYINHPIFEIIKRFGNLGVDIFLLVSGIGLYYSVQRLSKKNGEYWLIPFFKQRIIRILPATIICLLPWYFYLYRGQNVNIFRFLLDITSISYWMDGNNRGWYVALSIVLYAFYPLFYFMITKCKTNIVFNCSLLIALDIIFNTIIAIFKPDWFGMVNLALCRVPVFIIGCFLAPKVNKEKEYNWLPSVCFIITIILVLILIRFQEILKMFGIWRYLYGCLGFCVTVILAIIFNAIHGKWLSKVLCFFGKYTLELYLTHTQILTVLSEQMRFKLSAAIINILAVVCSIIISIIVHEGISYCIERIRNKL